MITPVRQKQVAAATRERTEKTASNAPSFEETLRAKEQDSGNAASPPEPSPAKAIVRDQHMNDPIVKHARAANPRAARKVASANATPVATAPATASATAMQAAISAFANRPLILPTLGTHAFGDAIGKGVGEGVAHSVKDLAAKPAINDAKPIVKEATSVASEARTEVHAMHAARDKDSDTRSESETSDPSKTGELPALQPEGGHEPAKLPSHDVDIATPVVEEPWLKPGPAAMSAATPALAAPTLSIDNTAASNLAATVTHAANATVHDVAAVVADRSATGVRPDVHSASEANAALESGLVPDGHVGTTRATLHIGEGADRIALQINATPGHIRVEATMASSSMAQNFNEHRGDLQRALEQHGIALSLQAGVASDTSQQQAREQTPRELSERSDGKTLGIAAARNDDQPNARLGVRVMA